MLTTAKAKSLIKANMSNFNQARNVSREILLIPRALDSGEVTDLIQHLRIMSKETELAAIALEEA